MDDDTLESIALGDLGTCAVRPLPAQQVIDALPFYVLIIDEDHVIRAANRALRGRAGIVPDELVGGFCPTVVHGTDSDVPGCPLPEVLRTGMASVKELHDAEHGRWLQSAIYPLPHRSTDGKRLFLHTALDITEQKEAQLRERDSLQSLHETLLATIDVTARAVDAMDPYTAGHQRRVGGLASAIAESLGLPARSVEAVGLAGFVHDVGKIGVPAGILNKPGRLTAEEMDKVKEHPRIGWEILAPVEFPWPIAEIVLQHHERMDGSGYPSQLQGEQIMLEARIIAIADVVEAMSLSRPYREALGLDAALSEIVAGRGSRYDAPVVDACVRLFREQAFVLPETDGRPRLRLA
jgi:hypothetical protein